MDTSQEHKRLLSLVVDDEMVVRVLVREVLEQSGHGVCEVENGTQALDRFTEHRPGIVLMDIMMPGMGSSPARNRKQSE